MDGKHAAPLAGRRVVFAGIRFLCRAGPMCPAEKCVPGGGARGPRPTGQVRYPPVGDGVPTSHQRGSAALSFRASAHTGVGIRSLGRGKTDCRVASLLAMTEEDAVPYGRDVVPQGHLFRCAPLQDAVPYETGRRGRRPLQFLCGTSRTPSPTGRTPSPTRFYPVISTRVPSLSSTQLS